MPFNLSLPELLVIFVIILLLFGSKRLPELASGMGKGIRDFKRALNGLDTDSIPPGPDHAQVQPPLQQPAQVQPPAPVQQPVQADQQQDRTQP
jgi:sec-independent protein translocase protein TatA